MTMYLTCEIKRIGDEDYKILEYLGKGTYGEVVMAVDNEFGRIVALKLVKKEKTKLEAFLHELSMSIYLTGHEGIISTHSSFLSTMDYYIFSQELAPAGTLQSVITPREGMSEKLVKRCALQITQALQYMHGKGLVHRDLKPDNVLLMDKRCRNIKLSDFGLTQAIGTVVPSMSPIIPYMSPELCELRRKETIIVDPSVDIWAFGVLLYVACTGYFPWKRALDEDLTYQRFAYWQRNIGRVSPPSDWEMFSTEALELFYILLSENPSYRNQVGVVLNYLHFPWNVEEDVVETIDLVEQEQNEDVEMRDSECEVIVLEGEDELIIVENRGDLECIILDNPTSESDSDSTGTRVILLTDDSNLHLGSEVEV